MALLDTNAIVGHAKTYPRVTLMPANTNLTTFWGVFHGIGNQVTERTSQIIFITQNM